MIEAIGRKKEERCSNQGADAQLICQKLVLNLKVTQYGHKKQAAEQHDIVVIRSRD